MEFFIDTADIEAIREANELGFISGVTTNPSLIAKEKKDFHSVIQEIAGIVDGPVSAEVLSDKAEDMIGREVLVMIEGKVADENAYVGRTYRDAPNVDGLIFINTDVELISGDFAKVKVTGALDYDLIGELM